MLPGVQHMLLAPLTGGLGRMGVVVGGGERGRGAVGECSWETVHPMEEAFCYRPHECFWTMLLCVTLPVMKFCELKDVVACMHSQST